MRFLIIGCVLVAVGLGFIFYWGYSISRVSDLIMQEALSAIGDKGGTLYLRPGTWSSTDKMVTEVVPQRRKP